MPRAVFIPSDGKAIALEVAEGTSLMRAAVTNGIDSIVGDCGGVMSCATCHVLVDPLYLPFLPALSDNEDMMLDCTAAPRAPNSRLSCQIMMDASLDGIVVHVADPQL